MKNDDEEDKGFQFIANKAVAGMCIKRVDKNNPARLEAVMFVDNHPGDDNMDHDVLNRRMLRLGSDGTGAFISNNQRGCMQIMMDSFQSITREEFLADLDAALKIVSAGLTLKGEKFWSRLSDVWEGPHRIGEPNKNRECTASNDSEHFYANFNPDGVSVANQEVDISEGGTAATLSDFAAASNEAMSQLTREIREIKEGRYADHKPLVPKHGEAYKS